MPSNPSLQAWRKTTSPDSAMCSLSCSPQRARRAAAWRAGAYGSRSARAPQVPPVELKQIEGAQDHVPVAAALAQLPEDRNAVVVAGDRLAVDQAGAGNAAPSATATSFSAVLSSCHWKKLRAASSEPIY